MLSLNTLDTNLLLQNEIAKRLYHELAVTLPVIDYHNHLDPLAMLSNKKFSDITDLWIHDDQYKHRIMRINGVEEKYITGEATNKEKFLKWMETFPKTIGNPLYHWSQLEIIAIFDGKVDLIQDDPLQVWEYCNSKLGENGLSAIDLLKKWNVEMLCTSAVSYTHLTLPTKRIV